MKTLDKQIKFFEPSGCVSEIAFFKYLNNELRENEMQAIEEHISGCLFCFDAMEGFEKQADKNVLANEISAIRKDFKKAQSKRNDFGFKKEESRKVIIIAASIAASIAILISGYYLSKMQFHGIKKVQLATQTEELKDYNPNEKGTTESTDKILPGEKATENEQNLIHNSNKASDEISSSDNVNKYFDTNEGFSKSDEDKGYIFSSTGKSTAKETNAVGGKSNEEDYLGGNGITVLAETESTGEITDITSTRVKKNELQKEESIKEYKTIVDDGLPENFVSDEAVITKQAKNSDKYKNEPTAFRNDNRIAKSTDSTIINDALADFNSGNFDTALKKFENILLKDKNNYAALYYAGLCYYSKDQKEKALFQFDKLIKMKDTPFYEMSLWQSARIYEESVKNMQALEMYRKIVINGGSMKNKAVDKVNELEKSK